MRDMRLLVAVVVLGAVAGTAMGQPWSFADNFDSYADRAALQAAWQRDIGLYESGWISGAALLMSPPNNWEMKKNYPLKDWRSLVPGIQAIDPSKNAVNGTAANPLIVSFQMNLLLAGKEEKTIMWLELVGQEIGTLQDNLYSAPIKNPGSYGTPLGVCGPSNTCTDGYYGVIGDGCARDADCDAPMWLDFIPNPPTLLCTVLDQSLPVPRPSLAFGVYGGTNGLVPKGVPGDACAGLSTRGISSAVAYDGDRWLRLSSLSPLGSSSGNIPAQGLTTDITLTIRDTDFDITAVEAVDCGYAGRCDNTATCTQALAGTCVNNICSTDQGACTTDADCNFCSDDTSATCTTDADCRSNVCEGGPNAGNACTLTSQCAEPVNTTCLGGPDDGAACTPSGTPPRPSETCARKTFTKTQIPRQYLGPFRAIALGPGRPFEGLSNGLYYGSDYTATMDTITITGGELLTVPSGSCCLVDGTCVDGMMEAACTQIAGGEYNGDGVTCASARCATGACCTALGCVPDKTQSECEDPAPAGLDGVFQGISTTCENRICCPEPFADADWDGDVDQNDFGAFQACFTGSSGGVPTGCECFNRDSSVAIDGLDFTAFDNCFSGPNVPWVAGGSCVP